MPLQEVVDGVVIGRVPELTLEDARDLAIVDRWIQIFDEKNVAGDMLGEGVGLAAGLRRALVDQAEHALLEEAARLVGHRRAIEARFLAAHGDPFTEQHDGADDFIVVLDRIGEQQP